MSGPWPVTSLQSRAPPVMHLPLRFILACSCALVCHGSQQDPTASSSSTFSTLGVLQGVRSVYRTYQQCEADASVLGCLKLRAIRLLERANTLESIPVAEGVSLVGQPELQRSLSDSPVDETTLPLEPALRDQRIDTLLWSKLGTFFQTHSVQLQVPKLVEESKALLENEIEVDDEEGRGKKKKYAGPILVGLMMKGMMVALAYKALALLAGKALIVSKLALVLAGIVALKKLFSGGDNQKTTYEIVKQPVVSHAHQYSSSHEFGGHGGGAEWAGSASGGYGRSIQVPQEATEPSLAPAVHGRSLSADPVPYPHLLAYRGQLPKYLKEKSQPNQTQQ